MSTPSTPSTHSQSEKANWLPAATGFIADVAAVIALLLAAVKFIALVLGAVAVLFGAYLIIRRWGTPFHTTALVAVVILAVGTGIIGVVIGHEFSPASAGPATAGAGVSRQRPDLGTPQSSSNTGSPSTSATPSQGDGTPRGTGQNTQPPSPSTSASDPVNSPVAPANLGDPRHDKLTNANGFGSATDLKINGKSFTYGLSGCKIGCSIATSDFDLGRSYASLTARLGVLDSSRDGKAHIQIVADGNVIESKDVRLGVCYDITVSVKNVLRLQFVEGNDGGVVAAVGDPIISP